MPGGRLRKEDFPGTYKRFARARDAEGLDGMQPAYLLFGLAPGLYREVVSARQPPVDLRADLFRRQHRQRDGHPGPGGLAAVSRQAPRQRRAVPHSVPRPPPQDHPGSAGLGRGDAGGGAGGRGAHPGREAPPVDVELRVLPLQPERVPAARACVRAPPAARQPHFGAALPRAQARDPQSAGAAAVVPRRAHSHLQDEAPRAGAPRPGRGRRRV